MKKLWILAMVVVLFVLVGCEFSPSGSQAGGKFIVDGINATASRSSSSRGLSSRDSIETFELWLMSTRRGWDEPISHHNVASLKRFAVSDEGAYEIALSEFPERDPSVVFIVRLSGANTEVMGFLSLKVDETQYVLEFPPRTEMTGDVVFGMVSVSEDSYVATSERSLEDNAESFSRTTLQSLQQQALTSNLALMAINILANTHEEIYYAPSLVFKYDLGDSTSWGFVDLYVFSNDYTSKAALFTPQGVNMNYSGDYKEGYGPQSSVQWSVRLPLQDFLAKSKKGEMWELKDEQGVVLAAFDFSIALVLEEEGNPIIPCIEPTYTVQADNPLLVDTLSFNWFSMGLDGTTKNPITDEDQLARMVSKNMIHMDLHTGDSSRGTYMFRTPGEGGAFGMEGSLMEATNFNKPLKVADLYKLTIGYRYTFYDCRTPWRPKP